MAWMLLASSLLFGCYLARLTYRWHRLCHIPGPFWTSFRSGYSWPLNLRRLSSQHGMFNSCPNPQPKAYPYSCIGGLTRVGLNQLVTSDIDSILRINSPTSGYSGGPVSACPSQGHCSPPCLGGVKCTRRATPCGYTRDSALEVIVDRQCERLIRWIEDEFISTKEGFKPLDMTLASHWLVSSILRDLAFGEPCASLEQGQGWCNRSGTKRKPFSRLMAALLPIWVMRGSGSRDGHCLTQNHLK